MVALKSGCALLATLTGVTAFVPQGLLTSAPQSAAAGLEKEHTSAPSCRPMRMSLDDVSDSRKGFLKDSAGLVAGAMVVGASTGASQPAEAASVSAWEQIQLPVASVLYDIAFDPEHPDHGLVVGAQGTFLEASMTRVLRIEPAWPIVVCRDSVVSVVLTRSRMLVMCHDKNIMSIISNLVNTCFTMYSQVRYTRTHVYISCLCTDHVIHSGVFVVIISWSKSFVLILCCGAGV